MQKRFLLVWCTTLAILYATCAFAQDPMIIMIKNPAITAPSMPRVVFNHDAHEKFVDEHQGDCSSCHKMTKDGLSTAVLNVLMLKKNEQVPYMHETCTGCHRKSGKGPQLAQCRSCHTQSSQQAMK